jgi:hypothetical protein
MRLPASVVNGRLAVWNGGTWDSRFLAGINLGITIPGTQPGARAVTKSEVIRWFVLARQMGIDFIRIYDLWPDWFYQVGACVAPFSYFSKGKVFCCIIFC